MGAYPTPIAASPPVAMPCGACRLAESCATAPDRPQGPFRGAALVGASLVYFLLPAALALIGAALAGGAPLKQLIGGAGGLIVGMLIANLAARRISLAAGPEDCFEPR